MAITDWPEGERPRERLLAHGPAAAVLALIDWAHRGPELARVQGVQATDVQPQALPDGFQQRETV